LFIRNPESLRKLAKYCGVVITSVSVLFAIVYALNPEAIMKPVLSECGRLIR
jgi:hypothetical protein